jgi:hypothetical protein
MAFRILLMMGIVLGLWIGFGAPIVGLGVHPMQPDPSLPTFSDLVRDMEENPERYEQPEHAEETAQEMEDRVCALSPKHCRDNDTQEAPELE